MKSQLPMARKSPAVEPSPAGSGAPILLPQPPSNSIGNFIDNHSSDMSFIQCNVLAMGEIDGQQFGVGFPIDMPVMLTYFDNNELKPVKPDYPDYDHLINHVSVQLDSDDFQLYKTPIVLTLQGEFEDAEFNAVNPFELQTEQDAHSDTTHSDYDDEYIMGDEVDGDKELTLEELMKSVEQEIAADWTDEQLAETETENSRENSEASDPNTDPNDDNNRDMQSFWSSPVVNAKGNLQQDTPDLTITRPDKFDPSEIPDEATVSAEDTRDLQRAHRKADRIMEYADDIKLIGSFHYKKRNFHLVRLLEPIFVMGKRIPDIKGYFFSLLDERETEQVRPVLEQLLLTKAHSPHDVTTVDDNEREPAQEAQDGRRGRRGSYNVGDRSRVGQTTHFAPAERGRAPRGKQTHETGISTDTARAPRGKQTHETGISTDTARGAVNRLDRDGDGSRSNRVSHQTGAGATDGDSESRFQKARRRWKDLKDKERSA